jgi:proteasome lid subunit RPN8/RPN11
MLVLPDTYVISGKCHRCGKQMSIERRKSQMWDSDRWCPECRTTEGYETVLEYPSEWEEVKELTLQSDKKFLARRLDQLGIPKDDVVQFMSCIDGEYICRYVRLKEEPPKPKFVITESFEVEPFPIELGPDEYYKEQQDNVLGRLHLSLIIDDILSGQLELDADDGYHCFIEKDAFNEFVDFATGVHEATGYEATGIFAGYWLSDGKNRYAYCTHFLPAKGKSTAVTCTIEPEDFGRFSDFCRRNNLTQLVWVHSHPGFGAFFSNTDDRTLRSLYRASQYMGVVVDIFKNEMAGFKTVDGELRSHSFHIVDTKLEVEV